MKSTIKSGKNDYFKYLFLLGSILKRITMFIKMLIENILLHIFIKIKNVSKITE